MNEEISLVADEGKDEDSHVNTRLTSSNMHVRASIAGKEKTDNAHEISELPKSVMMSPSYEIVNKETEESVRITSRLTKEELNCTLFGRTEMVAEALNGSLKKDKMLIQGVQEKELEVENINWGRNSSSADVHILSHTLHNQFRDEKRVVFTENTKGRFQSIIIEDNDGSSACGSSSSNGAKRENVLNVLLCKAKGALLFVQGSVSGLSIHIFNHSTLLRDNLSPECSELILEGQETLFLIFSTLCMTSILLDSIFVNKESKKVVWSIRIIMTIALYFAGIVLSFAIKRSGLILQKKVEKGLSAEKLEIYLQSYNTMGISRSACYIFAYLVTSLNVFEKDECDRSRI